MKKIIPFLLSLLFVLPFASEARADEKLDFVEAKSAVLMCIDNGEVLYKENETEHLSPASVTKKMTILLVLEALENKKIKLTDKVTASAEAVSMGGSQIWLEVGEIMTVEELFKAVVVASANDACTAFAEYVGGSTASFVKIMNDRAAELGCKNTNFENCNGLDDTVKNHYSCAYDLALISCEVMKHKLIKKYTGIWLDSLRNGETELNNTNKLVNTYNGITGLKTGTTSNAGFCVSATAERDGMQLVAVVLGSETSEKRFYSAALLLDWGFANYEIIKPEIDVSEIKSVKVKNGVLKSIKPVFNADNK
ncbi:MAG: D-alanyl-D-alanine carboxypeptidase, partial [Eubacterium sp.]|nr:D-alanyl-D-alanine carboxypeptidase [Eubacterium sp.]